MASPPFFALSCLNPAIGLSTTIVMLFDRETEGAKSIYVYVLMPLIGGVFAVIFHELIFKKVQETITDTEEQDNDAIEAEEV